MKQRMEKMISTIRESVKRRKLIRKTVGLGLAIMMLLEAPSWGGLIGLALAHEDKVGTGRCIYVDTSLIGVDSDVMESGIGAYVYDREGNSYSDAPIIMEKVDGKKNIYQLVLDDYYTYVEFTKGSSLSTSAKTGALAIDWSLGAPCYMFNSEALSDGGYFYGLYTVYFDLNGASDASAFADNGVGVYAYNSDEDSYTSIPVSMKASGKGNGIYEYSFDRPYDCVAFTGGYGSWNYEVATEVFQMEWNYSAPCFCLEQVNGYESTGIWRNLRYTVYFDASDIKEDEAFIENGVWLYAFNDSDDKLSDNPVKMVASSAGSYVYEYTMERPYENLQFILGDSLDAEVASEVLYNDWLTYAEPCYKMALDRKEVTMASPSASPSMTPSASPSGSPSATPSVDPSASPSGSPSATPSTSPSVTPSMDPSASPSSSPSATPSITPSANPTATPTAEPIEIPTPTPTEIPTVEPTEAPTTEPTEEPTPAPIPEEGSEEEQPETEDESQNDNGNEQNDETSSEVEEQPQPLDEARAVGRMTVTYGSYKATWVGTENEEEIELNTIEEDENSEDTDETDDVDDTDESATTDDSQTAVEPIVPETPETPMATNVPTDENPAPTTDDETDGTQEPAIDPDMVSPSPTASPEGIEDDESVKTTMSLLSSTGATMLFSTLGAMSRAMNGGTKVVYYDPSYTKDYDGAWGGTRNEEVWVHLFGSGWATELIRMQPSSRINPETGSKLLEIDLSSYLTEEQMQGSISAIFVSQATWPADTDPNYLQTVNIELTGSHPCYWLTGEMAKNLSDGKTKRAVAYAELGPESQGGNPIYFVDMTSQLNGDIVAVFGGDEISDSEDVVFNSTTKKCEIPNDDDNVLNQPYTTVTFYDSEGNQLGETYNLFNKTTGGATGFFYDKDTMNTFYYGATEKTDGTKISYWGAPLPEEEVSLTGKMLYFDKLYFKTTKSVDADDETSGTGNASGAEEAGAKFRIGIGEEVPLTVSEEDERTYIYTFDSNPAATSKTVLTYIDQDGTEYHFLWNEFDLKNADGTTIADGNNLVTQKDEIAAVMGQYVLGNWIYFDATMSKLPNESVNSQIPYEEGVVWCMMATGKSGENARTIEMTKVEDRGTWKDIWKIDLPEEYTYVRFANYKITKDDGAYANGTDYQKVPANLYDPCFYADAGDDAIYGNNWRGGYWDEVYTLRDPELIKETPVVDITQTDYTKNTKRLYVKTTLYDYYTDYELNGNNRDSLSGFENMSARDWVPFREFNQALSDYYEEAGVTIPLYTGHFQPHDLGGEFKGTVADALNLYGYGNYENFFSTNNSMMDIGGGVDQGDYSRIARGFVANELKDGQIYSSGNRAVLPYFNEDFLAGNNSKNAVLGKVYENVSFPFELKENYHEQGVSYWVYDSNKKSLEMRETSDGEYYLYEDEEHATQWWSKNRDSKNTEKDTYGFFPFNSGSLNGARSYNYGYAAKLEIKFRLTEDGTVEKEGEGTAPIRFDFSGDDDVWVFIDGHLALDMGGVHSPATGTLYFNDRSYEISSVKKSAGSSDLDKTGSFEIDGCTYENGKTVYDTREHTLTMFYMERGMWESNMKISFNFPDENQLEVEKKVDTTDVNDLFKNCFDGQKIFGFSIRNLATHFAPRDAAGEENATPPYEFNFDFDGIRPTSTANTFESVSSWKGHDNVAYWLALLSDGNGAYRKDRYGVIPSMDGAVDTSRMKYLQFSYYYAGSGYPSLSDMYLWINTTGGSTVHTLGGKIYGPATMKPGEWVTLTVDLDLFFSGDSVNRAGITDIGFGYNYPQPFYLDDFEFKPETTSQKLTGFITKQPDIPDYGSATSAQLEIPRGAMYTRKLEGVDDTYGKIDKAGTFALENGETVLFRDQFRRGSYIELKELLDSPVFSTTWTMYENDQLVKRMGTGTMVELSTTDGLINVPGVAVDDGRREIQSSMPSSDGPVFNDRNNYQGIRPDADVFVFRSYSDPDSDAGVTKLKVVYTNKVNVGSLTIKKSQADGSQDLNEEYRFRVTFTNIAGMGLEGETAITKEFKLRAGGVETINGIPLNTEFVIEELKPADKSFLEEVTKENDGGDFDFDAETGQVKGKINKECPAYTFNFSNMLKSTISIEVEKIWMNADGSAMTEDPDNLADSDLPENISIRPQRRIIGSNAAWESVEKYKDVVQLGTVGYERIWKYKFSNLEKYVDNTDESKGMYEYRVVEVDVTEGTEKVIESGGFWDNFQVSYKDKSISGKEEDDPYNEELYTTEITNVHTVSLKVKKVDASGNPLGGVSFQLQKKDSAGNWVPVEISVNGSTGTTITTPTEEENPVGGAGVIIFSNLPSGEYQLVETATAPGHTLLAAPIPVTINAAGDFKYTINGEEQTPVNNTIELTIKNGQNLVMPATGGAGPIPFTVGGLSICMIASLMYIDSMRKRRKEGKAS